MIIQIYNYILSKYLKDMGYMMPSQHTTFGYLHKTGWDTKSNRNVRVPTGEGCTKAGGEGARTMFVCLGWVADFEFQLILLS